MRRQHEPAARVCTLVGILFSLAACDMRVPDVGPGHLDFSAKLAGGYSLHRTSADQISISPDAYDPASTPHIPDVVVECNTDGRFIIARRQGLKRRGSDQPLNPSDHDPDHAGERDPNVFDYWVLDTAKPVVFGPMDLDQFETKKRQLGIAESLSLRDVYEFDRR